MRPEHAVRVSEGSGFRKGRVSGLEEAARIARRGRLKTQAVMFNEGAAMRKSIADTIRARIRINPKR